MIATRGEIMKPEVLPTVVGNDQRTSGPLYANSGLQIQFVRDTFPLRPGVHCPIYLPCRAGARISSEARRSYGRDDVWADVERLPDSNPPCVEARIGCNELPKGNTLGSGDGRRRVAGLDSVVA